MAWKAPCGGLFVGGFASHRDAARPTPTIFVVRQTAGAEKKLGIFFLYQFYPKNQWIKMPCKKNFIVFEFQLILKTGYYW